MMLQTLAQTAATAGENLDAYFMWGCILFGVAFLLLVVELFVPSGGLIGLVCGVAAVASIVAFFKYDTAWGIGTTLAYIILTPITLVFVFKLWLNSPIGKTMILGDLDPAGPEDAGALSEQQRLERLAALRDLLGAEGVAETALRPVGTIRIGDHRIDGMAESGVIEAGTPITVIDVYDNQVKVRVR